MTKLCSVIAMKVSHVAATPSRVGYSHCGVCRCRAPFGGWAAFGGISSLVAPWDSLSDMPLAALLQYRSRTNKQRALQQSGFCKVCPEALLAYFGLELGCGYLLGDVGFPLAKLPPEFAWRYTQQFPPEKSAHFVASTEANGGGTGTTLTTLAQLVLPTKLR